MISRLHRKLRITAPTIQPIRRNSGSKLAAAAAFVAVVFVGQSLVGQQSSSVPRAGYTPPVHIPPRIPVRDPGLPRSLNGRFNSTQQIYSSNHTGQRARLTDQSQQDHRFTHRQSSEYQRQAIRSGHSHAVNPSSQFSASSNYRNYQHTRWSGNQAHHHLQFEQRTQPNRFNHRAVNFQAEQTASQRGERRSDASGIQTKIAETIDAVRGKRYRESNGNRRDPRRFGNFIPAGQSQASNQRWQRTESAIGSGVDRQTNVGSETRSTPPRQVRDYDRQSDQSSFTATKSYPQPIAPPAVDESLSLGRGLSLQDAPEFPTQKLPESDVELFLPNHLPEQSRTLTETPRVAAASAQREQPYQELEPADWSQAADEAAAKHQPFQLPRTNVFSNNNKAISILDRTQTAADDSNLPPYKSDGNSDFTADSVQEFEPAAPTQAAAPELPAEPSLREQYGSANILRKTAQPRRQESVPGPPTGSQQERAPSFAPEPEPNQNPLRKSCEEFRSQLLNNPITEIALDISPPAGNPDLFGENNSRVWRDFRGNELVEGTIADLSRGYVVIDTVDGGQVRIPFARLGEPDLLAVTDYWRLPLECGLGNETYVPRNWAPQTAAWHASALCHKPLYFENVQLERYGHSHGPFLQPIASTAHFFGRLFFLPYNTAIHPPNECQYALGFYRPGNCAPWLRDPVPFSLAGATRQGLFWTGFGFIVE